MKAPEGKVPMTHLADVLTLHFQYNQVSYHKCLHFHPPKLSTCLFVCVSQVFMWPWWYLAGGGSLRASHGRTAWQCWWEDTSGGQMKVPGWSAGLWCVMPTCLASSSTAPSALLSIRGFPPCSTLYKEVCWILSDYRVAYYVGIIITRYGYCPHPSLQWYPHMYTARIHTSYCRCIIKHVSSSI